MATEYLPVPVESPDLDPEEEAEASPKSDQDAGLQRLLVRAGERAFFVRTRSIRWIEADGKSVKLHLESGTHSLKATMNYLERMLPPQQFLRISRSVIVNIDQVRELRPLDHADYEVVMSDDTRLILTRSHRQRLSQVAGPFALPLR